MAFGSAGWFTAFLADEVAQHQPLVAASEPGSPRARARSHVRAVLQDSGLLYGTPEQAEHPAGMTPEEQLSLAVLRTLTRLALDLADLAGLGPERRVERLTILFAAWAGHLRLAETLQTSLRTTGTLPRRSVARLEELLEDRAISLGGDPVYGLLLHDGAAYVDAQLFAHLSLAAWLHTSLGLQQARRRLAVAARQKALLVEVLTALACSSADCSWPLSFSSSDRSPSSCSFDWPSCFSWSSESFCSPSPAAPPAKRESARRSAATARACSEL